MKGASHRLADAWPAKPKARKAKTGIARARCIPSPSVRTATLASYILCPARVTNQPEKGYQYLTGGRSGQPVIQSADKPLAQLLRTLIVFLLGTKNTVTGIAQAGNNITVRIKVAIDGRGKYLDIGMCRLDRVDAFGRRHQ